MNYIIEIILAIIAITGPIVSTKIERKRSSEEMAKLRAETRSQEVANDGAQIKNVEDAMEVYKRIMEEALDKQNSIHKAEIDSMESRLTRRIVALEKVVCMRMDCAERISNNECPINK